MAEVFDIAIVGAGPAGLCAARTILSREDKPSVILIEKNTDIDKKIPCAEGVGKPGFDEVLEPKSTWIRSEVSHLTLHSPDDTTITYTGSDKGYIINRALMQHDLADSCLDMGAEGLFSHTVLSISKPNSTGIRTLNLDNDTSVLARVVVDCSGPLSRFGESERIDSKPLDLEVAYFAHIEGIETQTDTIHVYIGKEIAPGGYAWAFPRNEQSQNIGLVLGSNFRKGINIRSLLDSFIETYYPNGKIIRTYAGSIPCYNKRITTATAGLLKAGDAVSTVNPISRAGISESMKSGTIAGTYAVEMLHAASAKEIKRVCKAYDRAWQKKLGNRHLKLARVKRFLEKVTDEEYNQSAKALASIPQDQITMSKIFTTCLKKFPKLILALRHLM